MNWKMFKGKNSKKHSSQSELRNLLPMDCTSETIRAVYTQIQRTGMPPPSPLVQTLATPISPRPNPSHLAVAPPLASLPSRSSLSPHKPQRLRPSAPSAPQQRKVEFLVRAHSYATPGSAGLAGAIGASSISPAGSAAAGPPPVADPVSDSLAPLGSGSPWPPHCQI
jgi:hypothetical protein